MQPVLQRRCKAYVHSHLNVFQLHAFTRSRRYKYERTLVAGHSAVGDETIRSRFKVQLHAIRLILQFRSHNGTRTDIIALAVVNKERQTVYFLRKCVGIFHVVIIDETQGHSVRTRAQILVYAFARRQ